MIFMGRETRRGKVKGEKQSPYFTTDFPEQMKKNSCIYMNGEVSHSCKGTYKVKMENGMNSICTASKMDHKRIGVLVGDYVTVEIPADSLYPGSALRGRICWRMKSKKTT